MVDTIMYQEDGYVVLETNQEEQLMTKAELLVKLEMILKEATEIPSDVSKYETLSEQAQYLLDNYCEFNIDDNYLQWYVVRWEK